MKQINSYEKTRSDESELFSIEEIIGQYGGLLVEHGTDRIKMALNQAKNYNLSRYLNFLPLHAGNLQGLPTIRPLLNDQIIYSNNINPNSESSWR